jgi:DNA-binding transcriptional LysR family regulator
VLCNISPSSRYGSRTIARHLRNELDLFQLKVLDTLLREQSLTRAAEALKMTQPALSKTLARLRDHFDDPLFVRVAFQMKPTTKALALAPQIASILRDLSVLQSEQLPFSPETSGRDFKFAGPDAAVVLMLPPVLMDMRKQAPNVRLSVVQLDVGPLHDWLESGVVDLAAGDYPFLVQGIKRQRLFRTNYLSLVRLGHPRIEEFSSLKGFADEQHVLVAAEWTGHYNKIAQDALELVIPKKKISARAPGSAAAALLAKYTGAIVTLPRLIAIVLARELDLEFFEPPVKLPDIEIYQYWHERYDRDPGHVWLRSLFYDHGTRIASR